MCLKERVQQVIEKKIPPVCGFGCPVVCCDPIIIGDFMSQSLLDNKGNYDNAIDFLNDFINETLLLETKKGETCFNFEGLLLTEVDTEFGFIGDDIIEKMVVDKIGKKLSEIEIKQYSEKIKDRFRELNIGILSIFSCSKYDKENKMCTIHNDRPELCRNYSCEQLNPEKVDNSIEVITKRINAKSIQRKYIQKNSSKDILSSIKNYLSE